MFLSPEVQARLQARFFQYRINESLDSSGNKIPQKAIQSGFHFWSEFLTIAYTTLDDAGLDDGVSHISMKFFTGANQIALGNDPIDVATIATPGRQRSVGVAGDPSQGLGVQGFPMPYLWEATGSIGAELSCDSATANSIEMVWTGFLIPTRLCPTAQDFWELLAGIYRQDSPLGQV